ncbi:MAG: glycosyltransferase family 4 protein [Nocardiopsaceae bacterium]|nr:glycosyltransferase family 4 protein [Nocardiopsaceae bacterium]
MRIALVHRDLHAVTRGGICTLYRALAPRLRDAGHDLTLITQHTPHPLAPQGISVVSLPRTEDLDAHRAAVDSVLAQLRPDIVESSSWEAETLHYVRRTAGERAPLVVRGDLSAVTMGARADLVTAERELLHRADTVLAVSDFAADDLAAAYGIKRPRTVPNGIDRALFRPDTAADPHSGYWITITGGGEVATSRPLSDARELPPPWGDPAEGRVRLVWVGKTTPMKGWDRLEHLTAELADLAHTTILLGHAPALSTITLSGAQDGVTVLRDLQEDDLPGFYQSADFLLSTSRWEGFGLAIAEALACGIPVLLPTGLGTAPELLAAGGGHTYRSAADLRRILISETRPAGRLPTAFDWDRNTNTTIEAYRALRTHRVS